MKTCPDHEKLTAFSRSAPGSEEAREVAEHVESCPRCRALALASGPATEPGSQLGDDDDVTFRRVDRASSNCPGRQALAAFSRSELEGEDARQVAAHLEGCPSCRTAALGFGPATQLGSTELGSTRIRAAQLGDDAASASRLERGTQVGRYIVLELLGAGGMGAVYRAYDPELDRKVALKLVRDANGPISDELRLRLQGEAKALAKLSHPNVLTVYDVGVFDGQLFIATELLEGGDLRQWLNKGRSHREILDAFVAAGRGLAAAHRANLVHRDFKPENVLVGLDGQVRVADFGLARVACSKTNATSASVAGTPAYMAPEQLTWQGVDGRSDQFSFGVSLFEAFQGERPHRLTLTPTGPVFRPIEHDKASERRVPPRVRRIAKRALSPSPDDRYPSMDALLAELAPPPSRARLAVVIAVFVVAAIALGVGATWHLKPEDGVCGAAREEMERLWSPNKREGLRRGFLATGHPLADEAWQKASAGLDRYLARWSAVHADACRAPGENATEADMLLRLACLEQKKAGVLATLEELARPDRAVVENAAQAVNLLEAVDCDAVGETSGMLLGPPASVRKAVEGLRRELEQAKASHRIGRFESGRELAAEVARRARALYRPLEAEALLLRGHIERDSRDYAEAERAYRAALHAALASGHTRLGVEAASLLAAIVAERSGKIDLADELLGVGAAALARLGEPQDLNAQLLRGRADVDFSAARYAQAVDGYQAAIALHESRNPDSLLLFRLFSDLGTTLKRLGRYDDALPYLRRAREGYETLLGESHVLTAGGLINLATLLTDLGRPQEATVLFERSLAIIEKSFGKRHVRSSVALINLGFTYYELGQFERALELNLEAVRLREQAYGESSPKLVIPLINVGHALVALGRSEEAVVALERAVAVVHEKLGVDHPNQAEALYALGKARLALGRSKQAVEVLERSCALYEKSGDEPGELARAHFTLARALWNVQRDRQRARKLAEDARDTLGKAAPRFDKDRREVEGWLATLER